MYNFYSDTQTMPTRAMRESILDAPTGDERHDGCPTTLALCDRVADLFGMEAAMFLPSGTMCNEIAIAVHCRPGDEVICTRDSHIIFAESGGPAALSGVMMQPIDGERGLMTVSQVENAIRPNSTFAPRSRLLIAEQTANLGGGTIWPLDQLNDVAAFAKDQGLMTHMDGARILNATVASGIAAREYGRGFDSAWIAFTKGLGCPVGAVLAGSHEFIKRAWLFKRRWGGAMRQTGVLTAMCLYALDHHVDRLAEDHALAASIAERLTDIPAIARVHPADTNIVLIDLVEDRPDARTALAHLMEQGVQVTVVGERRMRIVTHMDVDTVAADALVNAFAALS